MSVNLMFMDGLPESPSVSLADVVMSSGMLYTTPGVYVSFLIRDSISDYPGQTIQDFLNRVTKSITRNQALDTKYAYFVWALLHMGAIMETCSYPLVGLELDILEPEELAELKTLLMTTTSTKDILCRTPTPNYETLLTVNGALTSRKTKSSMR